MKQQENRYGEENEEKLSVEHGTQWFWFKQKWFLFFKYLISDRLWSIEHKWTRCLKRTFCGTNFRVGKKNLNRTKLSTIVYYLHFNVNGDLFMGAVIALIFQLLMRSQLCKIDKKRKGHFMNVLKKRVWLELYTALKGTNL